MTFQAKPRIASVVSRQKKNGLGLTKADYEGGKSTLCGGCGHDAVTAAIIQAFFEMDVEPYRVGKMSGIGCSSKTPGYFLSRSHGFNGVHGRMLPITTGASVAHHQMDYLGVSGDGDSASIGIGHLIHGMRRHINMLYLVENNGVYGLTKGQFSAMADKGSRSKGGKINEDPAIDLCRLGLEMGAGFIARGFSGDRKQLVPLIKAGFRFRGFSIIDIISPCVTFNNHQGSTRSYEYSYQERINYSVADFVEAKDEIKISYGPGENQTVRLHDGSVILLKKISEDYDPRQMNLAKKMMDHAREENKILTGLLYLNEEAETFPEKLRLGKKPLRDIPFADLCPGETALSELNQEFRG